jgi:23S rRNA U2552 (ribose-2'-O)-methylase RlmE/FtsJ
MLHLKQLSGQDIDSAVMQDEYEGFMREGNTAAISSFQRETHIEPIYSDAPVLQGYENLCRRGNVGQLRVFIRSAKIPFFANRAVVQEGYVHMLTRGSYSDLHQLEEIAGVPFDDSDITRALVVARENAQKFDDLLSEFPKASIDWEGEMSSMIPAEVYESVRKIANKEIRIRIWKMLHKGVDRMDQMQARVAVQDTHYEFLPPHLHFLFAGTHYSGYPEFIASLDRTFTSIHRSKVKRSERKANLVPH